MNRKCQHLKSWSLACLIAAVSQAALAEFDFETGDAATEVVIPTLIPVIFQDVSSTGGDAPLVLRVTTLITNAWFDAAAPYHPPAVGVYTRIDHTDPGVDQALINTSLLYASYRVLNSLLPQRAMRWREMMSSVNLDPDDLSVDTDTAVGIGNAAGFGVVLGRQNDGMNQLGNERIQGYNPKPYDDYTGYEPVNTPHLLKDPSKWQPDIQRQGVGLYKVQKFVTPQYALVEPYSYPDALAYYVPPPLDSRRAPKKPYQAQVDEVLRTSAELTDERKIKAELFDNKIESLGFSTLFAAQSQGLDPWQFIQLDFLLNMAAFDAGIVIWHWKRRYDAVRPFSAISHVYGDQPIAAAWGGPGQGTVDDLPASEWRAYLEEADHPEYPSASACFCEAHAQAARQFLPAGDTLGFPVQRAAGSSRIEPGVTPAVDTTVVFPTWTDFAHDCGQSRIWAGVHFPAAVEASADFCAEFGNTAYDYLTSLLDGTAPERGASQGRPW